MASRLTAVVTAKLLSLHEAFSRIEPSRFASLLQAIFELRLRHPVPAGMRSLACGLGSPACGLGSPACGLRSPDFYCTHSLHSFSALILLHLLHLLYLLHLLH